MISCRVNQVETQIKDVIVMFLNNPLHFDGAIKKTVDLKTDEVIYLDNPDHIYSFT